MGVDANPIALSCRNQVARHVGQGCFPETPRMTGSRRRPEKPLSIQSLFYGTKRTWVCKQVKNTRLWGTLIYWFCVSFASSSGLRFMHCHFDCHVVWVIMDTNSMYHIINSSIKNHMRYVTHHFWASSIMIGNKGCPSIMTVVNNDRQ
jgi:hypothetical protein